MGLASSFMEPLQTGSIHDTVIQVKDLVETSLLDTVEQTFDPIVIDSYNRRSRRLFNDYLDFLCVSYAGGREDTEFWRWIKYDQQLTDRAKEILELSKTRLTRELDFDKFMGYGSQGLYNYTLAGLGLYSKDTIKSMFTIHGIDINSLTKRQYSFERAWLQKMSSCLTSVELNQYLAQ
jgi:tryptophan halogenase